MADLRCSPTHGRQSDSSLEGTSSVTTNPLSTTLLLKPPDEEDEEEDVQVTLVLPRMFEYRLERPNAALRGIRLVVVRGEDGEGTSTSAAEDEDEGRCWEQ